MMEMIEQINFYLWGYILTYLLLFTGIYFTLCTKFFQFRRLPFCFRILFSSRTKESETNISSFQAFCTSLASRIGTGNMAGVAVAIHLGGPGSVFWMWLIALIGMATSLVENTLAQLYKTNEKDGSFRGGPSYYIEKALGARWAAVLFSLSLTLAFGFAFNGVQANSVAAALVVYDIPSMVIGVILACVAGLIIVGGIHSIARFAELVVPTMAMFYLILSFSVVVMNITHIPDVFMIIIKSAFGIESIAAGGIAYSMKSALEQGIKRGLFSNEAGMGSAPNAAATATPHPNHPIVQGCLGMLGVFSDTIIICTATAAIILLSGENYQAQTGIALTQLALAHQIGPWGQHIVALSILLFAFSTIIANYYYGEANLKFIFRRRPPLFLYRISALAFVVVGAVADLKIVWTFADMAMGFMAVINLVSILLLSDQVFKLLTDFEIQVDIGETVAFNRRDFPFLDKTIDQDVWT